MSSNQPSTNPFYLMNEVERFCRSHKLQPIPLNYTVSYEHLSGLHPGLSSELTDHVSLGHQLNLSFIAQLHQDHLASESPELLKSVSQVKQVIENLLKTADSGSTSVDQLTSSLNQGIKQLAEKPAQSQLEAVISELLDASLNAKRDQVALNQQLQRAKADANALKQQLHQTQQQAMTDPLTGLLNRAGMDHHLESLLQPEPLQLSLVVFDIDHFKHFNDDYGHLLGDKVLQVVATQIKASLGEQDLAIRFGGEEVLIVLPQMELQHAVILADKIRQQVKRLKLVNKRTQESVRRVTLSAGVAQIHNNENWDDLLERADKALYRAKNAGRDQVQAARH